MSDNDIFTGARLGLNDESSTALLAGAIFDVDNSTTGGFIEAERRLNNNWKVELEARLFLHSHRNDPAFAIQRDDSINLKVIYSF